MTLTPVEIGGLWIVLSLVAAAAYSLWREWGKRGH